MHVVRDLETVDATINPTFDPDPRRRSYEFPSLENNNYFRIGRKSTSEKFVSISTEISSKFLVAGKMEEVKKAWREADAVMFDMDSTVVREEGIDELAKFCGKGSEVSKITKEAMDKGLDYRESLKCRLEIMSPTLEQVEDFIKLHPSTLTPGIEKLVRVLHEKNVNVYLVSGGFRRVIESSRKRLNVPVGNVFANRLLFVDGKYSAFDLEEPTSKTGGKAEVAALLKKKFGYKKLVMVGDGATDAEASPPADAFIGFGGNVIRENVKAKSKWFVTSFQELIDELIN